MSQDTFADVDIDSPHRFKTLLTALVEKAVASDVQVRGTWEFATRESIHDWEVEPVELARGLDEADDDK